MTASDLQFTNSEEPQVEDYRPLSGLAVTSFVLGLGSILAVISSYLVVLPPVAGLLAILALRQIRASGEELSGRRLANAALVLACFFGAWGVVQHFGRPWVISSQARRFCDGWLQLVVDGNVLEAYQWTMPPENRLASSVPLGPFYEVHTAAKKALDDYFKMLPFRLDAEGSGLRSSRYLGNQSVALQETGEHLVSHRYQIMHERDGKPRTDVLIFNIVRFPPTEEKVIHWRLRDSHLDASSIHNYR
jgi:hypothetical protein